MVLAIVQGVTERCAARGPSGTFGVRVNRHGGQYALNAARPAEPIKIPSQSVANIHHRPGAVLKMKALAQLNPGLDAEVSTEEAPANLPSEDDVIANPGPVSPRRPSGRRVLTSGCNAQARWTFTAGEVTTA